VGPVGALAFRYPNPTALYVRAMVPTWLGTVGAKRSSSTTAPGRTSNNLAPFCPSERTGFSLWWATYGCFLRHLGSMST